jgi:hypothetical protein
MTASRVSGGTQRPVRAPQQLGGDLGDRAVLLHELGLELAVARHQLFLALARLVRDRRPERRAEVAERLPHPLVEHRRCSWFSSQILETGSLSTR